MPICKPIKDKVLIAGMGGVGINVTKFLEMANESAKKIQTGRGKSDVILPKSYITIDESSKFNKKDFEKVRKLLSDRLLEFDSEVISTCIVDSFPEDLIKELESKKISEVPETPIKRQKQKFGAMGREKTKRYF